MALYDASGEPNTVLSATVIVWSPYVHLSAPITANTPVRLLANPVLFALNIYLLPFNTIVTALGDFI